MVKNKPRLGLRSKLALPPRLKAKKVVEAEKSSLMREEEVGYCMLTLIQYLSADMPRYDGVDIQVKGPAGSSYWSISGRGRTFLVRRFPTGSEMDEMDFFRPSHALKCLRSSQVTNSNENSLRYRSLIQELRILRHPPLVKHPNLLRIFEASWELDLMDGTKVLPTISTEFATWGTLQSFLLGFEEQDWPVKSRLLLDVVEGLTALHACSIVHGDMKMDNVLIFSTPDDPECPVIAKLSDFGFSLDVSQQKDLSSLVGFTPLWAAPEYNQSLSVDGLKLTDVYSLGFIVWSVMIDGRNPFEEFQDHFGGAEPTGDQVGMFIFMKETNEILELATTHVQSQGKDLSGDVAVCCDYLNHTLQLDPAQRNLNFLLDGLRKDSFRRKDEDTILNIQYSPIVPFDIRKIMINKWFFQNHGPLFIARDDVVQELELVASGKIVGHSSRAVQSDQSVAWRFPLDHCERPAAAAFAVAQEKLYRPESEKSISIAGHWLSRAARAGLTFAKALCGRLSNLPGIQISLQEELEWLQGAAKIGSRIALSRLKARNETIYHECFEYFRAEFWAGLYAIPSSWREIFKMTGDISSNLAFLVGDNAHQAIVGNWNCSPLHCAAIIGSIQGVQLLISKYELPINSVNDRLETALFLACRSGHGAVVEYLLSQGADAGICNLFAENGLHWLDSFEDHYVGDLVASLCHHGANIDAIAEPDDTFFPEQIRVYYSQWYPGTPLQRAVANGNLAAVCALLEYGASSSVQYRGINAIDRAAQIRQADILGLLLAYDPSVNLNEERVVRSGRSLSPIHRVVESVDKLQLLYIHGENHDHALNHTMCIVFAHGIDLRSMKLDTVHYTVQKRNVEALRMMLEHQKLDVNERETTADMWTPTPLMRAIYNEDEETVELLLRYGADAKADLRFMTEACFSTLHLCVSNWHKSTRIAERLIGHGVDVNHNKDPNASDTPLYYALFNNRFHLADLFLRHGASLSACGSKSIRNVMGDLLYAQPGRLTHNTISFLVEHPLKPEIPFLICEADQTSVFHYFCSKSEIRRNCLAPADFLAIFALLRQIFPDSYFINLPDNKGFIPLHYAAWFAYPEAVRALLDAGADPFYCTGPRTSGEDDVPPIARGMSVVEMVQKDEFCPLLGFAKINAEERAKWVGRREEVKKLLELYV